MEKSESNGFWRFFYIDCDRILCKLVLFLLFNFDVNIREFKLRNGEKNKIIVKDVYFMIDLLMGGVIVIEGLDKVGFDVYK